MFACRIANEYGLGGFVRNLGDGSVEVVATGERSTLEVLLERLRSGPFSARVDDIECEWSEEGERYHGFDVRY